MSSTKHNQGFYEAVTSRPSIEKREEQQRLESDVEEFLARGGKIKVCPPQIGGVKRWSYVGVKQLGDKYVA